jgi:ABC-2 type transport system ATP-binding protein
VDAARAVLAEVTHETPTVEDLVIRSAVSRREGTVAEALRRLDDAGVEVADLTLRRPSLDDVFLKLTGRAAEGAEEDEERAA